MYNIGFADNEVSRGMSVLMNALSYRANAENKNYRSFEKCLDCWVVVNEKSGEYVEEINITQTYHLDISYSKSTSDKVFYFADRHSAAFVATVLNKIAKSNDFRIGQVNDENQISPEMLNKFPYYVQIFERDDILKRIKSFYFMKASFGDFLGVLSSFLWTHLIDCNAEDGYLVIACFFGAENRIPFEFSNDMFYDRDIYQFDHATFYPLPTVPQIACDALTVFASCSKKSIVRFMATKSACPLIVYDIKQRKFVELSKKSSLDYIPEWIADRY